MSSSTDTSGHQEHRDFQRVVIAGVGKLGTALMNCPELNRGPLHIVAAFDRDPTKLDPHARIPILPIEQLRTFIVDHEVTVGVLTLPQDAAQRTADLMVLGGVRGILNCTPTPLRLPKRCIEKHCCFGYELKDLLSQVHHSINTE